MAKAPGCWEHVSLVWDELKATKSNKHSTAAVWLDIANASGSLSHRQIFYSQALWYQPWLDRLPKILFQWSLK